VGFPPPTVTIALIMRLTPCLDSPGLARVLRAARNLRGVSWGKDLNCELQDVYGDGGNVLKYLPKKYLDTLEISHLGYSEIGLLFRAEYDAAWEELNLQAQTAVRTMSGGVVAAGQPGIGTLSLLIIGALLIIAPKCRLREINFSLLPAAPPIKPKKTRGSSNASSFPCL
jgi:hypothetical protein